MHKHPQFRTEYLPNGLRAITTKQFVSTMSFFMRFVVGNARGHKLPADISTDDIGKWLAQIRYPHMQSRSWLKTPNVPHAFHHLVELINWLSSFIPDDSTDPTPTFRQPGNYFDSEQCFPSTTYICSFLAEVHEMFVLFNQDFEYEQPKRNLIAEFVQQRRLNLPNAVEYIAADIIRMQREVDDLGGVDNTAVIIENVNADAAALDRETKQMHANEAELNKLFEIRRTSTAAHRTLQAELKTQQRQQQQLEINSKRMAERVSLQRICVGTRDKLLHAIQQRRDGIAAEKAAIEQLRTAGHEKHLACTTNLKRQMHLFTAVQQHVHVIGELLQSNELLNWKVDSRGGTEECGQKLQILQQYFVAMRQEDEVRLPMLRSLVAELSDKLSDLRAEHVLREASRDDLAAASERLAERHSHLDELRGMSRVDYIKRRTELQVELTAMADRLEKSECHLCTERDRLAETKKLNERKLEEVSSVANRLIDAKLEGLNEGYELLNELNVLIKKAQTALDRIEI